MTNQIEVLPAPVVGKQYGCIDGDVVDGSNGITNEELSRLRDQLREETVRGRNPALVWELQPYSRRMAYNYARWTYVAVEE